MRTAESAAARSSRELWADICAALPGAEQAADAREAFADSFAGAGGSGGSPAEAPGGPTRAPPKPWAPLQDSAVYLASLGECASPPVPKCLPAPAAAPAPPGAHPQVAALAASSAEEEAQGI